jgi:hypothetical protein
MTPRRASRAPLVEVPVPVWDRLRDLRHAVSEALAGYPDELRHASMMTASELAENALKYGLDVRVSMDVRPATVSISVTNTVVSPDSVDEARKLISRVTREKDPEALYLSRMAELMEDSRETGRLGLYRVAGEGKFRLRCRYANQRLTITATREIHARAS